MTNYRTQRFNLKYNNHQFNDEKHIRPNDPRDHVVVKRDHRGLEVFVSNCEFSSDPNRPPIVYSKQFCEMFAERLNDGIHHPIHKAMSLDEYIIIKVLET